MPAINPTATPLPANNMANMDHSNMPGMGGNTATPGTGTPTPGTGTPAPAAGNLSTTFTFHADSLTSAVTSLVGLGTVQSNLVAEGLKLAAQKASAAGKALDASVVATFNLEAQKAGDFATFAKKMDDERRSPLRAWLQG